MRILPCAAALAFALGLTGPALTQDQGGPYGYAVVGPLHRLSNGGRPWTRTPFPPVADWGTLKIALERTVCYGTCPWYRVEIAGDGTVEYQGRDFVAIVGSHKSHISPDSVRGLLDTFKKADFFWTFDAYNARNITDLPTYTVTISFDGHAKTLKDYAGVALGMPKAIVDLENQIDAVAGTAKWVKGNDETFTSLEAEHWDFHTADDEHLALIKSVAVRGDPGLLRRLLAAGTSANSKYGCYGVSAAIRNGNQEIVDLLLGAGAPVHWDAPKDGRLETCDVLTSATLRQDPKILQVILDRHPNVNWQDRRGNTVLMMFAKWAMPSQPHDRQTTVSIVRMLLAAGADPDIRNNVGENALMLVGWDADLVPLLLKSGKVDVNAHDLDGQTALMKSADGKVTQALLDAGADPWLADSGGKTAVEIVADIYGADNSAVAVLKHWMAAHPKHP